MGSHYAPAPGLGETPVCCELPTDGQIVVYNDTSGEAEWKDASAGAPESDPIFSVSAAFGIAAGDISNWDTAFGWGDHSGLYDLEGTAAAAVSAHESTYDHSDLHDVDDANASHYLKSETYTKTEVDTLIDPTLKAPEAYDPASSGNFPTTYGGQSVQQGDSFRITSLFNLPQF